MLRFGLNIHTRVYYMIMDAYEWIGSGGQVADACGATAAAEGAERCATDSTGEVEGRLEASKEAAC